MSVHRGFLCAAEMLGYAEEPGNITVSPVPKDYRYFSSHQSSRASGSVTVLDKGEDPAASREV